jgi:hypothetical protein
MYSTSYWSSCTVPVIGLHVQCQLLVFMYSASYWSSCTVPVIGLHVQYQLLVFMYSTSYSCAVLMNIEYFDRYLKKSQISNFMKFSSVGADLFDADGRTDMTKPIAAFSSFANAPKDGCNF